LRTQSEKTEWKGVRLEKWFAGYGVTCRPVRWQDDSLGPPKQAVVICVMLDLIPRFYSKTGMVQVTMG
jgi:hypothetical protein